MSELSFFLYEIFVKISRFSKSLSIDTLPGPDNNKLIEININNKSTSKPPCPIKLLSAFTIRTAQIISIVKRIEVILVSSPTINNTPPITSSSPIKRAKSAGMPTEAKKPCVPCKFSNFGNPWSIKAIPAIILTGKGANAEICSKYITKNEKSSFLYFINFIISESHAAFYSLDVDSTQDSMSPTFNPKSTFDNGGTTTEQFIIGGLFAIPSPLPLVNNNQGSNDNDNDNDKD